MTLLSQLTETSLSFYILLTGFGLVGTWEGLRPLRRASASTSLRWRNNFLWYIVNALFLRWLLPASTVGWSIVAVQRGWGFLPGLGLPDWAGLGLGMLALDLAGYVAHVLLHRFPLLWRLHAVHHSDVDFDCTTGFRFHPLEGFFTWATQMIVIAGVGVSPLGIALYETWLGLQNLYGHANAGFPSTVEKVLRWWVITPDLHRVHHSVRTAESQRNYGIIFPWWDRLFGTYQGDPIDGHEEMEIGLNWCRQEQTFPALAFLPFQARLPAAPLENK